MKKILLILFLSFSVSGFAQDTLSLTLFEVIRLAKDSSLAAFRQKNMYLADYWTFRNYKAGFLPSLTLQTTPVSYSRQLISRYDSNSDMDVYREQRSFSTGGGLTLTQNFLPLGGYFYINTEIEFLRYFGDNTFNQYSAIPVIIGYRNDILGFNQLKWNKKIEPLKFEKAKAEYVYNTEKISLTALQYFFALAQAQFKYENALKQVENSDSLLVIGKRRFEIAAVSKSDLMSLELDVVNAKNAVMTSEIAVKRAQMNLVSFLGLKRGTKLSPILPQKPENLEIPLSKAVEMMQKNNYLIKEKLESVLNAEMSLDKTNKTTRFNASVSASVGYNQQAEKFKDVYKDPMRRDVVSLSLNIPLIDWGTGRGSRNIAKNNLEIAKTEQQQKLDELEQNVIITVGELKVRYMLLESALKALEMAQKVYAMNIDRFKNASCDISALNSSQQRLQSAQNEYLSSMSDYWSCLYELRVLTLYDFEKDVEIKEEEIF
ncbi:MAG: TolC family protein [Bacteroidales bacterium]|nr:TolC family protein [Bacteroidales bacterium]